MLWTFAVLIVGVSVVSGKRNIQPECKPEMKIGCPKIFIPLCGSNDKTYANLCELCVKKYDNAENNREDITIQYEGECNNGDQPLEIQNDQPPAGVDDSNKVDCSQYQPRIGCNRMYFPICGSDGVSYNNECLLCLAREETGRQIHISRLGRCDDNTQQQGHDVKN
ncbi:hypothetical protein RvY_04338-1 [Ramazzottius varieornatus]|uniref:Kazal-like domain-containing protein n=1 Tax=Ramazzottius varieornatus TaxID=947166 RepID=A0A1D1URA5_RAMVA|nr:hypothetical protein RvY_04338-1 [Ramazzottius varieornatus]